MYLNERSWETADISPRDIRSALIEFVKLYSFLAGKYGLTAVYVPAAEEPYLRNMTYSIAKWLSETDRECRDLFLGFWQRRIVYQPEDEYEATRDSITFLGATEAILNNSFLISLGCKASWKQDTLYFRFYSLLADSDELMKVPNVSAAYQLEQEPVHSMLTRLRVSPVYSYEELWRRKDELFPHLRFCPSVQRDFRQLETTYLAQIIRKLLELDCYASSYDGGPFQPSLLSKTTPESEETLRQYRKEHTFTDDFGTEYIASWHMRFTGMAGRVFFVPSYRNKLFLICYVGKKLPNVTYPT